MTTIVMPEPRQRYYNNDGTVAAGCKLYTYAAGTNTPKATYTSTGATNTNPITLDSKGEADIRWDGSYKVDLKTAAGVQITGYPIDNFNTDPAGVWNLLATLASSAASATIGFIQAGAGAVARFVQDKLRERVTLEDFGAVGDGVTNDAAALRLATAYCASSGAILTPRAKTYLFTPSLARTDEAGSNTTVCDMLSNMHIIADSGCVFKISDGVSSDATPKRFSMFLSVVPQSNITFKNIIFDMNGANNPISPGRPAVYNVYTQAAILFSGTSGGVAARGDDVHIEGCTFKNTAGVTSIGCMQSNTAGVTLGKRWKIINNTFMNNGLDTNDHSSVYLWSDEVLCHGNIFTADTIQGTVGGTGGVCAIEVHGANQRITSNTVKNYYRGAYVAPNYTSDVKNVVVADNSFGPLRGTGVEIERIQAAAQPVHDIVIANNAIELTDDTVSISYKPAVLLNTTYAVTNVLINGNEAKKIGATVPSAFFGFGAATVASNVHDNICITNNQADGYTFGMLMASNATNGFGNVTFSNNTIVNMTGGGAFTVPAGVSGANLNAATVVKSLAISGNSFIDTRAVPLSQYGIQLSGVVTNLYIGEQYYVGMTVANYSESSFTATNRFGIFSKVAFTPTWYSGVGTAITVGNGSVSGEYTLNNGQVTVNAKLTVGSTTSFPGGVIYVESPFTAATSGASYHGNARLFDASASTFYLLIANIDGTTNRVTLQNSAGNISNTSPVTLATGDILSVQVTFNK